MSYASMTGNSLKYAATNSQDLHTHSLWRYYQTNNDKTPSSTSAHTLVTPLDNNQILNFINLNEIGASTLKTATAFKKIQICSKSNPQQLFATTSDFASRYARLFDLYSVDSVLSKSYSYGTLRQHIYTSQQAVNTQTRTFLDQRSIEYLIKYNYSVNTKNLNHVRTSTLPSLLHNTNYQYNLPTTQLALAGNNNPKLTNYYTDDKSSQNIVKNLSFWTYTKVPSQLISKLNEFNLNDLTFNSNNLNPLLIPSNKPTSYDYYAVKSSNQQILNSERNTRLTNSLVVNKSNPNYLVFNSQGSTSTLNNTCNLSEVIYRGIHLLSNNN